MYSVDRHGDLIPSETDQASGYDFSLAYLALGGAKRVAPKTVTRWIDEASFFGQTARVRELVHDVLLRNWPDSAPEADNLLDQARRTLDRCAELGIQVISVRHPAYPRRLQGVLDKPPILYMKGSMDVLGRLEKSLSVAVVGTRKPSPAAVKAAADFTDVALDMDAVVVSGLAYGCAAAAHKRCVERGGATVVVLAQGLDRIYPSAHKGLASDILNTGGALAAEHPPGSSTAFRAFPQRNRIQTGLSDYVFVAQIGRGPMHTIKFADQQGREVGCYVCPENSDLLSNDQWDVHGFDSPGKFKIYLRSISRFSTNE